jgi:signal transduction histidine kinase/PAS domain-containing protein
VAKQAQHALDLQDDCNRVVTLESVLLHLATDFVNLPVDEIDRGIRQILEFVATFTAADCCGVSELDRDTNQLRDLFTWTRPGTLPRGDALSAVDMTGMEALFGATEEPAFILDTTKDPRIPKEFGDAFAAFGIRSLAWFPIHSNERTVVAVGITSDKLIKWEADQVALLGVAGRMIANLRARARTTDYLGSITQLLQEVAQSLKHHFFLWEPDPPRLLYSNDAVVLISGRPMKSFGENPDEMFDLVLPEYRETLIALFAQGPAAPSELEYRIRHTDGSIRWLRTQVFPVKGSAATKGRLAGLTEDITERVSITEIGVRLKEFDRLLKRISSGFAESPLGTLDSAIGDALATLSSFADAERSHVHILDRNRASMTELARWYADAQNRGSDDLRFIPRSTLPHFIEEFVNGRTTIFTSAEDLPVSATAERAFLQRHGILSGVITPLTAAGREIGTLALTTVSRHRVWSAEEVSMLRVLGEVIGAAVARRESEREQQESLHFERLVTSLVSEFMNLPAGELDTGIGRAMETIARFVDCDGSAIFIVDESGDRAELLRGWWASGITPTIGDSQWIDTAPDSACGRWLRSDEPHLIVNPDTVEPFDPDSARAMRENRVGTVANLQLVINGHRVGWFAVGAKEPRVTWNAAELRSLRIAADALANMYSRRQSEEDRRRHKRFDDTLAEFAADFIKRPITDIRKGIEEIVDGFGRFAGCDRAAVLLLDPGGKTASTFHEWAGSHDPAPVERFPIADAPWFYRQLMTSTGPWLMHREEFPPSDENAGIALDFIGIRTLLNCPIADGQKVLGYTSIGYAKARHQPHPGTEQVLAVAAGIVANGLARERLEIETLEQRDALSHALRLGSMEQLATGIAHELNQPLTAIANYSYACVRRLAASDPDREALSEILERVSDEAIRAGDIIHHLRNHLKGGPANRRSTSVNDIVTHASSLLVGTAREHRVDIIIDPAAALPNVYVEPTEIEQVVINLVQNAIDSIAAANSECREVRIATSRNRESVEVAVSDTGPGFSGEEAGNLFDQFHTTKPGGMGLGLSISRYLIESNGGTIEADISTQSGATFRFALPVADA